MKVIDSWQGDAFYHYNGAVMCGEEKMKCARMIDGTECAGDIFFISPKHIQCEKCLIVHSVELGSE